MAKNVALILLACLLTVGVFVTAEQVDARTTTADMKTECTTSCEDSAVKSQNCCPGIQSACTGVSEKR